jgi:hypothetical protein
MIKHTCNPITVEAEAGGSRVGSQPGLHNELQPSLSYLLKPCFNNQGLGM